MNLVSPRCAVAALPVLATIVLMFLPQRATSAAEAPLTLDDAISLSLQEAPQIAASQASLDGAGALAPSASRLPDPEAIVGVDNLPVDTADRFSLTNDFMTM